MQASEIKGVALDLDGTILNPEAVLSERMINVVNKCVRRGIKIIIDTGRSMGGAEPYRFALGVSGPMVYFNGAIVADMPGAAIIKSTLLDKKLAEICVDISRESGVYCQIYFPAQDSSNNNVGSNASSASDFGMPLVADGEKAERKIYYDQTKIMPKAGNLKEELSRYAQGCVKAMFIAEPSSLAAIRPLLEKRLGDNVYMTQTQWNYLEVMNREVSKGNSLKFVMDRLSLKVEEVIAFGDAENDIPMSSAAGFFIVPENAKDPVKEKAHLIIGSNAEDGVAAFLERFFRL